IHFGIRPNYFLSGTQQESFYTEQRIMNRIFEGTPHGTARLHAQLTAGLSLAISQHCQLNLFLSPGTEIYYDKNPGMWNCITEGLFNHDATITIAWFLNSGN